MGKRAALEVKQCTTIKKRSQIVWKRIFMYLIISLKSEMEVSINSTTPFGGCKPIVILHCKDAQPT